MSFLNCSIINITNRYILLNLTLTLTLSLNLAMEK
uniref:Uncharacterized protein n=1 Tax=Rhizophora mucronata TaxID=61149 RepID=A0A2P2Q1Q5_RHIMU